MTAPNTGPNLMYSLFNGPKVDVICGDLTLFPSEIRGETRVFGSTFLQRRMKVEKPVRARNMRFVLSLTDLHQMVSVTDCVAEIDSLSLVSIFPLLLPCRVQNTLTTYRQYHVANILALSGVNVHRKSGRGITQLRTNSLGQLRHAILLMFSNLLDSFPICLRFLFENHESREMGNGTFAAFLSLSPISTMISHSLSLRLCKFRRPFGENTLSLCN